jgi:hypothetical protein
VCGSERITEGEIKTPVATQSQTRLIAAIPALDVAPQLKRQPLIAIEQDTAWGRELLAIFRRYGREAV